MDTSTKEELFRKVWAALYEEGNKDELQVREVVDQMYMAVKEPELDIEEVFDKVQREIGTVRNKEQEIMVECDKVCSCRSVTFGVRCGGIYPLEWPWE